MQDWYWSDEGTFGRLLRHCTTLKLQSKINYICVWDDKIYEKLLCIYCRIEMSMKRNIGMIINGWTY